MPCVVLAEKSKTCLGFEIGPQQQLFDVDPMSN